MNWSVVPLIRVSLLSLIAILSHSASGQSPRLERIESAGGQRGSTFVVTCVGERLSGVHDVLFYREGLSVAQLDTNDDSTLHLGLSSAADCPLGEHPLRLVSDSGVSELRVVHLGPYATVEETEPNNGVADGQQIAVNTTVRGVVEEGDVDCFRVSLQQGQRLAAEVVGVRNGGFLFDPWLAVLDSEGTVIASCDDTVLLRQDPMLSIVAPETGDYTVQVREAAFGGDLDSAYQLHVGTHPRPTVAYPAGGMRGTTLPVRLIGDAAGDRTRTVTLPDGLEEQYAYYPEDESGIAPSPLPLRVSDVPNVLEQEPNDAAETATATEVSPGFALNGIIEQPGDVDVFRFMAPAGNRFLVSTFAARIGSPLDSVLTIRDAAGRAVVQNDDGVQHDSVLRFTAPHDGEYTITVTDHLSRGGADFVYRIEFVPVGPALTLSVPVVSQRRPQQQQKVELAPGNRASLMVSARRENFSGEVQLTPFQLPPGVTATVSAVEPHSHLACIVFEAAPDAEPTHGLFGIAGVGNDDSVSVPGELNQRTGLVFGPPRQSVYHAVDVERIPIVVTRSAPFRLEVQPPGVPLVQDGQLLLRVSASRAAGMDGPIRLTLPFLPPWMELPEGGVEIPDGESEVLLPLKALPSAVPRTWDLVVNGEIVLDGESVVVSSGRFPVTIAEPYLSLEVASATATQGSDVAVDCRIDWHRDVSERVVARLRGLPKHVEVPEIEIPAGATECRFAVSVGSETPASIHNTLFVEVSVAADAEPITHFLGRGGELEVIAPGRTASETRSRLTVLREQKSRASAEAKRSGESEPTSATGQ